MAQRQGTACCSFLGIMHVRSGPTTSVWPRRSARYKRTGSTYYLHDLIRLQSQECEVLWATLTYVVSSQLNLQRWSWQSWERDSSQITFLPCLISFYEVM